jgi:AcrR family transcriptional regulator
MAAGRPALTSRAEIISAARRIFRKQGLDGLSVRNVAAAVNSAPSTIYNYFGTKQGLLTALANDLLDSARPRIAPGAEPLAALRQWLIEYRQLLLKTPDLIVLANLSGPVASVFKIVRDLFELLLRAGLSEPDAAICSRSLLYTANGFVMQEIGQHNLGIDLLDLTPPEEVPLVQLTRQFSFDQVFELAVDMNIESIARRFARKVAAAKTESGHA